MILLSNDDIMTIKKFENIVSLVYVLDHFGLRVMTEAFMNEEQIALEEDIPDKIVLINRLNEIFFKGKRAASKGGEDFCEYISVFIFISYWTRKSLNIILQIVLLFLKIVYMF